MVMVSMILYSILELREEIVWKRGFVIIICGGWNILDVMQFLAVEVNSIWMFDILNFLFWIVLQLKVLSIIRHFIVSGIDWSYDSRILLEKIGWCKYYFSVRNYMGGFFT